MKRQLRLFVVVSMLLMTASVLLWQLEEYERDTGGYVDSKNIELRELLDKSITDVQQVVVMQDGGDYTICRQDALWTIKGYRAEQMSQNMLNQCVRAAAGLRGEEISVSENNLRIYGLEEPSAWVRVEWGGGSYCFGIGMEAPGETGVYIRPEGEESVFLLRDTQILELRQTPLSFVDKTIIPELKQNQLESAFWLPDEIRLGGQIREELLDLEYNAENDTLKLISPFEQVLYSQKLRETLQTILFLEAEEIAAYGIQAGDYEKFGLAEEYAVFSLSWKENQETLSCGLIASKPENGKCYMAREGVDVIYVVNIGEIPWYDLTIEELFSTVFFLPDIADLSEIFVVGSGREILYRVGEGEDYQLADGRKIEADRFKQLYRSLIGVPAEKYTSQEPQENAEVLLSITYRYKDGREDDTVVLTEGPPLQMYISFNGRTEFLTNRHHLEVILWNIDYLLKDEELCFFY